MLLPVSPGAGLIARPGLAVSIAARQANPAEARGREWLTVAIMAQRARVWYTGFPGPLTPVCGAPASAASGKPDDNQGSWDEGKTMTQKVFISGIAGFLGSHLADRFSDRGWRVCGIDNLAGGSARNVPAGADFLVADCCDRGSYAHLLSGADLVYHCACAAYDGLSIFAPSFVFKNTAQATVDLATATISAGAGRFVHCSSMARYGALTPPFTEDMQPEPVTPYGLAKHTSELMIKNLLGRITASMRSRYRTALSTLASATVIRTVTSR